MDTGKGGGGITITGDEFHFHGVQNVPDLMRQLRDYRQTMGRR